VSLLGPSYGEFVDNIAPPPVGRASTRYEITIRYEDVEKRQFQSVMEMGLGGARLLTHSRSLAGRWASTPPSRRPLHRRRWRGEGGWPARDVLGSLAQGARSSPRQAGDREDHDVVGAQAAGDQTAAEVNARLNGSRAWSMTRTSSGAVTGRFMAG